MISNINLREIFRFNLHNRNLWVEDQAAKIPPNSKVLDVGAGSGRYRSLFDHCDYYTHDFGETPALNGKYTRLDYKSDIISIPVPDNSFDYILCTEVIEHVSEPIKAVEEMSRILKMGGVLFLTAPLGSFLHQEPHHYYGGFTPYWYKKFFSKNGLQIIDLERNKGFFSWFGQESIRFNNLISPRNIESTKFLPRIFLYFLWIITFPFFQYIFPLLGFILDKYHLENMATVGYHVVASKKNSKENK